MQNREEEIKQIVASKLAWIKSASATTQKIDELLQQIKAEKVAVKRYMSYVKNLRSTLEALGADPMEGETGSDGESNSDQ